ncbi:MAG TPA: ATPase domain-containing protein [Burkholderiales bacterium]
MNTEQTPGVTVPARKSTGVAGLDEILHGGLPSGRSYLVVGGAGSVGLTIKIINTLKRRLGGFDPDIRELNLSSEGLSVSTLAQRLSGVLSASPAVTRC